MEDITKTGPVGLEGLSFQENQERSRLDNIHSKISYNLTKGSKISPYENFNYIDNVGLELVQSGIGTSKYDENITTDLLGNIGDVRANNQSNIAKIASGVAKGVILAGTTFLDGTIGLLVGATQALGESRFSALWDNDFSKAMKDINEWSEEQLPNYYTDYEKDAPWYENIFTANFLGDKFIKNLGFAVGAFYSGSLYAGGVRSVGRGAMALAKRSGATISTIKDVAKTSSIVAAGVGSATSALNEGRIEALNNSTDWFNYQKAQLDDNLVRRLQALNIYKDTNIYTSLLEDAYNDYNSTLAKISEDRLKMGNADLLLNLPVLLGSNIIQFGKLFANGFNTAKKTLNIVGSKGNYKSGSTKIGALYDITKGALSEGTEELLQKTAAEASGNYYSTDVNNFYEAKINPDAEQETLSWMKSLMESINTTVNDSSSWEEFFIGSLTGALGIPTVRSYKNTDGKFQIPISLQGGAFNEWKDYKNQKKREEEVVNHLNQRIHSPEYINYYQGLIRHNKYQADMNTAVENNDSFNFKNAEHAQLVSDIIMFDEAGKIEDLKQSILEASGTSIEDLESIIRNTTTINSNGKLIGPFSQFAAIDGDQIIANFGTNDSKQQMINKLNSNKEEILNTIKKYQESKDNLLLNYGDKFTTEQLGELTWMLTQVDDWRKRSQSVVKEKILPLIDRVIDTLSIELSSYTSDIESNPTVEEFNLNNNINILKKIRSENPENISSILYKNPKIVEFLKTLALDKTIIESNQELLDVTSYLEDIIKMGKASDLYISKFKEYIDTPEKLSTDNQKTLEAQTKKLNKKVIDDKIQKLNDTSISDLIHQSDSGQINLDDLDSLLEESERQDDEIEEAKNKINEVKNINNTHRRLTSAGGIIDDIAGEDSEKQKTAKNAKILLSNSKTKAEGIEEFLDIDREAFLDPTLLYDEDVYKELSGDSRAIQEALNNDLDAARSLIQQAKQILEEENVSLDNIPSSQEGNVVRTLGSTGHDSTTSTVPVNNTNITNEDVSPYQFVTPSISSETFEKQQEESETLAEEQYSRDLENYWKPSITEYPIHRTVGDDRPFHEILRSSNYTYYYKVGNKIQSTVYNKETVDKMEKVYNYLKNKGAFSIVNSGQIQPGERVTFFTDKTLNNEVGEAVILIKDSKGRVIGNLTYENAEFSKYQTSLKAFRDKFIEEYEAFNATNDSEETIFEYGESTVAKNMIGKPQYTSLENMLPLNKIFSRGFKLGIAMTSGKNANIVVSPGRKKAQGQTKFERAILSPIDSVAGQSFVLLPTSRKQNGEVVNLTVPFLMAPYSEATRNTRLGKEIENIVKSFANIKTDKQAASAKFALQELLTLPDLHINLVDGNLIISLVAPTDVKQTIIYKGSPTNSNMVSQVLNKLASLNIPFQISRKYINTTFKGKDYNSMIGEIAETNLPTNTESTINEWFTINPISGGKEIKAKSPKTTGVNPNRAMPSYQEISIGDLQFTINSKTNEVLDSEGRPYNGKFANHVKAKAHAIKINAKQDSVVKTDWGYYDLATDDFITDEKELQDTSGFIKESTLGVNAENNNTVNDRVLTTDNIKELLGYTIGGIKEMRGVARGFLKEPMNTKGTPLEGITIEDWDRALDFCTSIIRKMLTKGKTFEEIANYLGNTRQWQILQISGTGRFIQGLRELYKAYHSNSLSSNSTSLTESSPNTSIKKIEIVSKEAIENAWINKDSYEYTGYEDLFDALYNSLEDAGNKYYESGHTVIDKLLEMARKYPNHPISKIILNSTTSKEVPVGNSSSNKSTSKTPTPSRSLINTKEKKVVFEALNTEQQNILISKSPAKQKTLMDTLVTAFDGTAFDESILGTTLDNFLTETKLRESNDGSYQKWDKEKELKWMQRVLPNLSTEDRLRVVEGIEGLIPVGDTGRKAYGRFRDGIIEIGRNAARGTVYHEAFHAVTHTLLSNEERTILFSEAKNRYGDLGTIKLEEKLAEDFRRYVQIGESGFYGVANRIFRTIKHLVKQLFGKEAYIDNLFYRINRGKLANINYKNSPNTDRTKSYTEEELSILEKAPRDSKGHLLSSNGKPTKLSERQYAQVRTRAFKKWFGDWTKITQNEDGTWNIPDDVSKVIDSETGEPKVVYHGSPNTTFTVFDKEKIGSNTDGGFYGRGFYFSEDKGISNKYGKEREFFLNIKNPYEINPDKIGWEEADRRAHIVPNFNAKDPTPYDSELSKYDGVLQTLIENSEVLYMSEIVVPNANQIKSATDNVGTFSTESNDIRYRNADISWYEDSIERERKELSKAINVLINAPTINRSIKFSDGTFNQYNPSAYLTEPDAVSYVNKEIPEEIRKAYEVRTYKGRYYIIKSQDRINNEIKRLEFITNKTISEYEREIQNIKNNSIIEASRQALEEQEVYYREVEQYHRDKYDIGRLSSEDKSYIKSRGISTDEYINMSFSEKDALFRCK